MSAIRSPTDRSPAQDDSDNQERQRKADLIVVARFILNSYRAIVALRGREAETHQRNLARSNQYWSADRHTFNPATRMCTPV